MFMLLDAAPKGRDAFIWTDFVELRALVHPDHCFSRGDLDGVARRARDMGAGFNAEDRWREVIDFAGIRATEFGAHYPFSVSADRDTVELEFDGGLAQKSYLTLLIASSMRNIEHASRGDIARAFEEMCFKVFSKLMPPGSQIRATWAHGGPEAPYVGTLPNKMTMIATDLRCTPNFKPRDFKPTDTGDGGIDLIAWHPMNDQREGMPIAFAQCGCSREDWRFKQLEASPYKHRRHLPVMHPWATYYFLPLDLRESDGDWAYKSDIGEAIVVDRLRLIRLAEQFNIFGDFPETDFVAAAQAVGYA